MFLLDLSLLERVIGNIIYSFCKDEEGSGAYGSEGIVQKAIKAIKDYTDLYVITDVCIIS